MLVDFKEKQLITAHGSWRQELCNSEETNAAFQTVK